MSEHVQAEQIVMLTAQHDRVVRLYNRLTEQPKDDGQDPCCIKGPRMMHGTEAA